LLKEKSSKNNTNLLAGEQGVNYLGDSAIEKFII
jgi:hypothetical protein